MCVCVCVYVYVCVREREREREVSTPSCLMAVVWVLQEVYNLSAADENLSC